MDKIDLFVAFQNTRERMTGFNYDNEEMTVCGYLNTGGYSIDEGLHIVCLEDGSYQLIIGRDIWVGSLDQLEPILFDFAMEEGYADDVKALVGESAK